MSNGLLLMQKNLTCLSATLALAGCFSSSPGTGLTFKPPVGWDSIPTIAGTQIWTHSVANGRAEGLVLRRLPKKLDFDRLKGAGAATSSGNVVEGPRRILERRFFSLCGNQPAMYVRSQATQEVNGLITSERVMTNGAAFGYIAIYSRPADVRPDPDAEAALYELCPAPR